MRGRIASGGLVLVMVALAAAPAHADPRALSGPSPLPQSCALLGSESESEPVLAVDPRDRAHLVAAWSQTGEAILATASADGGRTWSTPAPLPEASHCSGRDEYNNASNPWLAFDAGGTAYLSTMLDDTTFAKANGIEVSRSLDGGRTWDDAVLLKGDSLGPWQDAPTVTGDAVTPGRAYVTWQRLEGPTKSAWLSRTTDAGATWSQPTAVLSTPLGTLMAGDALASIPKGSGRDSGDLLLAYGQMPVTQDAGEIYVARSTDHGGSWSAKPAPALGGLSGPAQFQLAAAPGRRAYLVAQAPEGDLRLVASSDGGRTWAGRGEIVPAAAQPTDWAFAVDPRGTLAVLAVEHTPGPGPRDLISEAWLRTSADGGATWSARRLVGPYTQDAIGVFSGLAADGPDSFAAALVLGAPYASDVFFVR